MFVQFACDGLDGVELEPKYSVQCSALLVWPAEASHRLSPALQVRPLSVFLAKMATRGVCIIDPLRFPLQYESDNFCNITDDPPYIFQEFV